MFGVLFILGDCFEEGPVRLVLQDEEHIVVILEDLKQPEDALALLKPPVHADFIN
jgi:hypothetical protein